MWGINKEEFNKKAVENSKKRYLEEIKESVFDNFKKGGYVTAKTRNYCEAFDPEGGIFNTANADTDHEGYSFSCDPQYHPTSGSLGFMVGPYSIFKRCLYGKDSF